MTGTALTRATVNVTVWILLTSIILQGVSGAALASTHGAPPAAQIGQQSTPGSMAAEPLPETSVATGDRTSMSPTSDHRSSDLRPMGIDKYFDMGRFGGSTPVGPAGHTRRISTPTSKTVNLEVDCVRGSQDTETVAFQFTARTSEAEQVTVQASERFSGNAVDVTPIEWYDRTDGTSGTGSSFEVEPGHRYVVRFEVTATYEAEEARYDTDVYVSSNSKRYLSDRISAQVDIKCGNLGSRVSDPTQVVFYPPTDTEFTFESTLEFQNNGDGKLGIRSIEVDSPRGMNVGVQSNSSVVDAGLNGQVTLSVSGDKSIRSGEREIAVSITTSDGQFREYYQTVQIYKPPLVGADRNQIDLDGVVRGEEKRVHFTLTELTGWQDVDGIQTRITRSPNTARLELPDLSNEYISAGGSTGVSATVSVGPGARQHANLDWRVRVRPQNVERARAREIQITAHVLYRQYYESVSAEDVTFIFDKERPATYEQEQTVLVENGGDFDLDVTDAEASVDHPDITATFINPPDSIQELDSGTFELEVTPDDDAPEGEYVLQLRFEAAEADSISITRTVSIDHEVEMTVSQRSLSFETELTEADTKTIEITEALGYQDIEGLTIERVSGPDQWLSVQNEPSSVSAGSSTEVGFLLNFDTEANLYTEYTWEYRIDGERIDPQTITITGQRVSSIPQYIDQLEEHRNAGGQRAETATPIIEILEQVPEKRRQGEISKEELTTALTLARTTDNYLDTVANYQQTINEGNRSAAQDDLLKMATTYNTYQLYVSEFENPEFQSRAQASSDTAQQILTDSIENQQEYYRERIESDETSLLTDAQLKRELARIERFSGNHQEADRLQREANRTFVNYAENISAGEQHLQNANRIYDSIKQDSSVIVVADQPILLNPGSRDAFNRRAERVRSEYDTAQQHFDAAGATARSNQVADRKQTVGERLSTARTSLYLISGLYLLIFLVAIVRLIRNILSYIRDTHEAATGDFLA